MTSQPASTTSWDSLAQSIADGEAVLILGPDAIPRYPAGQDSAGVETSFSQLSRQVIQQTPGIGINYFYDRDRLFLFRDAESKMLARKVVRDLARDPGWLPDEELLRQIVAMPFHLVLSLSPDRAVYDAFCRYTTAPQFDFVSPYGKLPGAPISEPTAHNPLVFNLCGNVLDKRDSPILDYFDLFQLVIKLLGNSDEIPTWLGRKLREADTYILLGFQFDKWYSQLFLHYLNWLDNNAVANINRNFPILSDVSDDERAFILNQFNVQQVAPERSDFDALYAACARKGILRDIRDPLSPVQAQVRMLIGQDKLDEALRMLEQFNSPDIDLLKSRYQHWKQQQRAGTTDSRDLALEINRIRYALLTYNSQTETNV